MCICRLEPGHHTEGANAQGEAPVTCSLNQGHHHRAPKGESPILLTLSFLGGERGTMAPKLPSVWWGLGLNLGRTHWQSSSVLSSSPLFLSERVAWE